MNMGAGQEQPAAPIQEQAGQLLKATKEQATGQIVSQKDRVASTLGVLADALHQAGQQVRDKDDATIAGYVDSAADQIEQLATTLREQNLTQLIDTATRFGRRQPGLFLAATFALGFAEIRFMKSGSGQQNGSSENGKTGSGATRGDFWNDQTTGRDSGQYGGSGYGSGSASSGFGRSDDYAMGSGSSQGMPSGSSKSSRGADTMVGSEWSASRDYDAGSEGL